MREFSIEPHSQSDKCFQMSNDHIYMEIDYDDVDHAETDAAAECVRQILNAHWDEDLYKKLYREELMRIWNENKHNLQSDYENLDEYLEHLN